MSIASGAVRGRKTYEAIVSHGAIAQPQVVYLVEWVGLNLRELVFHIVRIHRLDLLPGGRTKNFDDLDQLIDAAFARK